VSQEGGELPRRAKLLQSWPVLAAICATILVATALSYGGPRARARVGRGGHDLCDAARAWRAAYGQSPDLQIIVTEVTFHGAPDSFYVGEGVVVVPTAVELPGAQDVLDVRGLPAPDRVLRADGVRALAWAYPGTLYRDLRFTGISLVRRAPRRQVILHAAPTFDTLPEELRVDARLNAAELEENHHLQSCKAFEPWVTETAGAPPYADQLLRVVRRLETAINPDHPAEKKRTDDACAALREGKLSKHQAHVVAVMAARQLGAPAYGFLSADGHFLVAVFVDGVGWAQLELGDAARGYGTGGAGLVTKAPIVGSFETSRDGLWGLEGGVYAKLFGNMLSGVSWTKWLPIDDKEDATVVYAVPLAEACP